MHQTLEKFGYPDSLLTEFDHWCVLLRPAQITLGALVLVSKSQATSLGQLPPEAFVELQNCCSAIERVLKNFRSFDKINYLALMMVDPHVHFHVLPRYASPQDFDGTTFPDVSWPGPPDLKLSTPIAKETRAKLINALSLSFANTA
jgi:diadenosine tetraphosphate (Ap4A) HIT family hydrolase